MKNIKWRPHPSRPSSNEHASPASATARRIWQCVGETTGRSRNDRYKRLERPRQIGLALAAELDVSYTLVERVSEPMRPSRPD